MLHFYFPVHNYNTHLIGRANRASYKRGLGEGEDFPQGKEELGEILPQAQEGEGGDAPMDMSTPAPSLVEQVNVKFEDAHPGFEDTRGEVSDPLRTELQDGTELIDHFFQRPIKVAEWKWLLGNKLSRSIDPWKAFFGDKRVINRIANYKLLKATLKVKFVLNGNSFYYGRALVSYKPLPKYDSVTLIRPGIEADLVEASQRPHIWLNPTVSQGGVLTLPFFTPNNMLDIPSAEWEDMGMIYAESPTTLKHANDGTTDISISVFVWAEDVELVGLTQETPASIVPQGMESEGIISKPASNVAKTASLFSQVPYIGNFARATEIGARAIGSMAALFGYSKPVTEDIPPFQPMTRQSMANCDGRESLVKLTVDPCNELTIDPAVAAIGGADEMTIASIATRESYLTKCDWSPEMAPEKLLFSAIVDPALVVNNGDEMHFPASTFAAMPFEYWRGTMRFRFQVVGSGFHKGRLKIVYDPFGHPISAAPEYNTAYTEIVDISEVGDFSIDIGWGQSTPWRHHLPPIQSSGFSYTTAVANTEAPPLLYSSSTSTFGNGTISVYVVNTLTVPATEMNNDAAILVSVSAVDDIEFASPTDEYIKNLGTVPHEGAVPAHELAPQGVEEELIDGTPNESGVIRYMGVKPAINSLVNKIHMGETIASFRQLCHRYQLHEIIMGPWGSGTEIGKHIRQAFPYDPGYNTVGQHRSNLLYSVATLTGVPEATGSYVYANMTLMNYLKLAYGGWRGAIRYTTDVTANPGTEADLSKDKMGQSSTWSVSRLPNRSLSASEKAPQDVFTTLTVDTGNYEKNRYELLMGNWNSLGLSGLSRWSTDVNPIQSYEIPYYSRYRFCPAKLRTRWDGSDPFQDNFELISTTMSSNLPYIAYQYVATGEDFTFLFYLSPPVFYIGSPIEPV